MTKRKKAVGPGLKVEYMLERIITGKFSYEFPVPKLEQFEIVYTIEPVITSNIEQERLFVRMKVRGVIAETQKELILAESLFAFKIKEMKRLVKMVDGQDMFPREFHPYMVNFIGISISTMRGIMIEKLRGTPYHNKIIPVMNPGDFLRAVPDKIGSNENTE